MILRVELVAGFVCRVRLDDELVRPGRRVAPDALRDGGHGGISRSPRMRPHLELAVELVCAADGRARRQDLEVALAGRRMAPARA